jgi:hypothetical protein
MSAQVCVSTEQCRCGVGLVQQVDILLHGGEGGRVCVCGGGGGGGGLGGGG